MKNARQMYQKLKSLGVKRIISIVPSCTYTLRNLIPDCVEGYDLEVKHWSEVVLENIKSKPGMHYAAKEWPRGTGNR